MRTAPRTRQATPEEAARFLREGTPQARHACPEDLYGDDPDVARVKKAALRCGRTWPNLGRGDAGKHKKALEALDAALGRSCTPQVRYWAQCRLIDPRVCGASGTGAYIAVASRLVNERARAELQRRGDAWREAGLGSFATVEAVEAAGLGDAPR